MTFSKTITSLAMCAGILAAVLADSSGSRGGLSSTRGGLQEESNRGISGSRGSSGGLDSLSGGHHSSGGLSGGRHSSSGGLDSLSGGRHSSGGGLDSLSGGYHSSGGSLDKLGGNRGRNEHSDSRRGFDTKSNSNRY